MFVVSGLKKALFGSADSKPKVNLDLVVPGKLFEFSHGRRKCRYIDCNAQVRKSGDPFRYELVVKNIDVEDDGAKDQVAFPTLSSLNVVRAGKGDSFGSKDDFEEVALAWRFDGIVWAFEFDSGAAKHASAFHDALVAAIWEREHKQPANLAAEDEIRALILTAEDPDALPALFSSDSATTTPVKLKQTPAISPAQTPTAFHAPTTASATPSSLATPSSSRSVDTPSSPAPNISDTSATPAAKARVAPSPSASSSSGKKKAPERSGEQFDKELRAKWSARFAVSGTVVDEFPGDLYVYNPSVSEFQRYSTESKLAISKLSKFTYKLFIVDEIDENDKAFHEQDVSAELTIRYSQENYSIVWMHSFYDELFALSMKFYDLETFKSFKESMTKCIYESSAKEDFEKDLTENDRTFVLDEIRDAVDYEPMDEDTAADRREFQPTDFDYDDDEEELERRRSNLARDDSDEENEDDSDEEAESDRRQTLTPEAAKREWARSVDKSGQQKITNLEQCFTRNRVLVAKGSQFKVFKENEEDHDMQKAGVIKSLRTTDGTLLTPSKFILHESEAKAVFLGSDRKDKIYQVDLNRPDIVDEWVAEKDGVRFDVLNVANQRKYGQMEANQVFVGLNSKQLFKFDPRVFGKNKTILDKDNTYKTNPKFNCMVATGSGNFVVGSEKGAIRLYDNLEKRAKTELPGLGDPITYIDVSEDGQWILATTDNYLLVYPTESATKGSGFKKSLGQDKPPAVKLTLKNEDRVKHNLKKLKFVAARFDMRPNEKERSICTSIGPWMVIWNFRKVLQGQVDRYRMKHFLDQVVCTQFRYNNDDKFLVALPTDVRLGRQQ